MTFADLAVGDDFTVLATGVRYVKVSETTASLQEHEYDYVDVYGRAVYVRTIGAATLVQLVPGVVS